MRSDRTSTSSGITLIQNGMIPKITYKNKRLGRGEVMGVSPLMHIVQHWLQRRVHSSRDDVAVAGDYKHDRYEEGRMLPCDNLWQHRACKGSYECKFMYIEMNKKQRKESSLLTCPHP